MNIKLQYLVVAALALLHLSICWRVTPNVLSWGHDGIALKPAMDIANSKTIYKEVFSQYGTLSPIVAGMIFKFVEPSVIVIKRLTAIYYTVSFVLIFMIARLLLSFSLSIAALLLWYAFSPYDWLGMQPNPVQEALIFCLLSLYFSLKFLKWGRNKYLYFTGVTLGVAFCFRQVSAIWTGLSIGIFFLLYWFWCNSQAHFKANLLNCTKSLLRIAAGGFAVLAVLFSYLLVKGAIPDWYTQTLLFPRQAYVGNFSQIEKYTAKKITSMDLSNIKPGACDFFKNWYKAAFTSELSPRLPAWLNLFLAIAVYFLICLYLKKGPELLLATVSLIAWFNIMPNGCNAHYWWAFSFGGTIALISMAKILFRYQTLALILLTLIFYYFFSDKMRGTRHALSSAKHDGKIEAPLYMRGVVADEKTRNWFAKVNETLEKYYVKNGRKNILVYDTDNSEDGGVLLYGFNPKNQNFHKLPVNWPVLSSITYPEYPAEREKAMRTGQYIVFTKEDLSAKLYREVKLPEGRYRLFLPK